MVWLTAPDHSATTGCIMASEILSAELLRELFHYDPSVGVFTWRADAGCGGRIPAGTVAGYKDKSTGYARVKVAGKLRGVHRIVWLYVHGEWPPFELDHINGIRDDNRLKNLRSATSGENKQNLRGARCDSKSGILGVSWNKRTQKWVVHLGLNGRLVHNSSHDTIESATAARRAAELRFHPFAQAALN